MASINTRTTKDGQTTYHVRIRIKGSPPQTDTFHFLSDTKKWIQIIENEIRLGGPPKKPDENASESQQLEFSKQWGEYQQKSREQQAAKTKYYLFHWPEIRAVIEDRAK